MEDERDAFIRAIEDHPDDPTYRYAYADWLDEQNDWKEAGRQRVRGVWSEVPTPFNEVNEEARIPRIFLDSQSSGWISKLNDLFFPFEIVIRSRSIWNEHRLETLLSNPKMTGLTIELPITVATIEQLVRYTQIEYLSLNCDQLQRNGLVSLASLHQLRHLTIDKFSKNRSNDFDFLSSLKNLERLTFRDCKQLNCNVLKGLDALPHFASFTIEGCPQIARKGLEFLDKLKQLSELSFTYTKLPKEFFHAISQLRQLKSISMKSCADISDNSIRHLTPLENLSSFRCDSLNDRALFWIGQLSELQHLEIGGSGITDKGLENLQELTRLETLHIEGTKISDDGLIQLQNFENLQVVHLLSNGNVVGEGLRHLEKFRSLRELHIGQGDLSDLSQFPFLLSLQILSINGWRLQLNDEVLKHLVDQIPSIRTLKFGYNDVQEITDEGFQCLTNLNHLETLEFLRSRITDESIQRVSSLASLRVLNLSGSQYLNGETLYYLGQLPRLRTLNLESCLYRNPENLRSLDKCQSLRELILSRPSEIESVFNHLKKALPRCNIQVRL